MKKIIGCLISSLLISFLSGCGGFLDTPFDPGEFDRTVEGGWGNYKCVSSSGNYEAVGWGALENQARNNAMDKCREHDHDEQNCRILGCGSSE